MIDLRAFQKRFLAGALAPSVDTSALSIARGNGKSALAAYLLARVLTPSDRLFVEGSESVLLASNVEQARIVYRFLRADLEAVGGYRFLDSVQRIGVTHTLTNTRLRVISSSAKGAMGLVGCPFAVADEPGSWETRGGELMHDALTTAQGKPGSPLRIVYIGTLAPSRNGWWHDMIRNGTGASTYVQALQGRREKWDQWPEIRRVNPLTAVSATFRKKLIEERNAARGDSRLKARFLSYRLNLPTADEATTLLTVDDWEQVCARPATVSEGRPIVGVDLGAGRAWSAAVAVWQSGRVEALACAPGLPDLEAQEKRDRVPSGTYRSLARSGSLRVAEGLRVQPPGQLVEAVTAAWGRPELILCDRFRLPELLDCVGAVPVVARVSRWSESSADIRALRKLAGDGPLSVAAGSRDLLAASLAVSKVQPDDSGNVRMLKESTNNTARDDVAAALVLAAGAYERALRSGPPRSVYRGTA